MKVRSVLARFRQMIASDQFDIRPMRFMARSLVYIARGKPIFAHDRTRIDGLERIAFDPGALLFVGVRRVGFLHHDDRTYLNVRGSLHVSGKVNIGRGCRVDIAPGATVSLANCGITGMSTFVIAHGLTIGPYSVVSWGCEFVDSDWHELSYAGQRRVDDPGIRIGTHVWIGSHARLYKGVEIGSGSVVAANSVVTRPFPDENVLIAGNPAQIVRRDVRWGPEQLRAAQAELA